jgi:putative restriction endonuclease
MSFDPDRDIDAAVRLRAFDFLADLRQRHPDTPLPRDLLLRGFDFEGMRVALLGPPGIFKPSVLREVPLSITTAPPVEGRPRPYDDTFTATGLLKYRYRGSDPRHPDNVGLRLAMTREIPLIYFHGIVPGLYEAAWPVYVVADDPASLSFTVAVDDRVAVSASFEAHDPAVVDARRRYITTVVQRRMHQEAFRLRVLRAYRLCCAICRLRHEELLDAAHILPDGHPRGEPIVPNGLALCKLHHAAFDAHILGITPDLRIQVRADILSEIDGPMLLHGLQGFQGGTVRIPREVRHQPKRDFLAERYELFRRAG